MNPRALADLEPEADESECDGRDHLEAAVRSHALLEQLREPHVAPDVLAQSAQAVQAQYEPQLQRAEPAAQRDLPVLPDGERRRVMPGSYGGLERLVANSS